MQPISKRASFMLRCTLGVDHPWGCVAAESLACMHSNSWPTSRATFGRASLLVFLIISALSRGGIVILLESRHAFDNFTSFPSLTSYLDVVVESFRHLITWLIDFWEHIRRKSEKYDCQTQDGYIEE